MIYAVYFGGLFVILVNVLLITRIYRTAKLILTSLILCVSFAFLPLYHNYFTEAYPTQYNRITVISKAIKNIESEGANALKKEIMEAISDKEVSIYEFNKISDRFDNLIKSESVVIIKDAMGN